MKFNTENKSFFWLLHICGWLLYYIVTLINFIGQDLLTYEFLFLCFAIFVQYFCSFCICLGLRFLYRRIDFQNRSLISLLTVVTFSSIYASHVITIGSILIRDLNTNIGFHLYRFSYAIITPEIFQWSIPFLAWSMLYFGIKYLSGWQQQKESADIAETIAQNAQFRTLRYQINQDFLFETLDNIKDTIITKDKIAKAMVTDLAEFLRYSLMCKDGLEIPLKNELYALENYISLENNRFKNNIITEYDIDPEFDEFPVSCFAIYSEVEKLVQKLDGDQAHNMKIRVSAEMNSEKLKLLIENSMSDEIKELNFPGVKVDN